uniref:JmjC domain-containing protein n=1 Tax=Panagrolaimus sp. JU765 TaxID=591449 RepID=A0AC34PV55_9BILA
MESLLARVNMLNNGAFQSVFDGSLLSGGIDRGEVPAWMNLNGIDNIIMDLKEGDDIPSVTKSELILGERASVSAFETGLMEMAQIIVLMPYSYPKFWICANDEDVFKIEHRASTAVTNAIRPCQTALLHHDICIDIDLLNTIDGTGVPYTKTVQYPGEMVVILPGGFAQNVDTGPNIAERCHFISSKTIELARRRQSCQCSSRRWIYRPLAWVPLLSLLKTGVVDMIKAKKANCAGKKKQPVQLTTANPMPVNHVSELDTSRSLTISEDIDSQVYTRPGIEEENDNAFQPEATSTQISSATRAETLVQMCDQLIQQRAASDETNEAALEPNERQNPQHQENQPTSSGNNDESGNPVNVAAVEDATTANGQPNGEQSDEHQNQPQISACTDDDGNNAAELLQRLRTLEHNHKVAKKCRASKARAQRQYVDRQRQNGIEKKKRICKKPANQTVEYVAYWFKLKLSNLEKNRLRKLRWMRAAALNMNPENIRTTTEAYNEAERDKFLMERHKEVFNVLKKMFGTERIDDRIKEGYECLPIARDFINHRSRTDLEQFRTYLKITDAQEIDTFWKDIIENRSKWDGFFKQQADMSLSVDYDDSESCSPRINDLVHKLEFFEGMFVMRFIDGAVTKRFVPELGMSLEETAAASKLSILNLTDDAILCCTDGALDQFCVNIEDVDFVGQYKHAFVSKILPRMAGLKILRMVDTAFEGPVELYHILKAIPRCVEKLFFDCRDTVTPNLVDNVMALVKCIQQRSLALKEVTLLVHRSPTTKKFEELLDKCSDAMGMNGFLKIIINQCADTEMVIWLAMHDLLFYARYEYLRMPSQTRIAKYQMFKGRWKNIDVELAISTRMTDQGSASMVQNQRRFMNLVETIIFHDDSFKAKFNDGHQLSSALKTFTEFIRDKEASEAFRLKRDAPLGKSMSQDFDTGAWMRFADNMTNVAFVGDFGVDDIRRYLPPMRNVKAVEMTNFSSGADLNEVFKSLPAAVERLIFDCRRTPATWLLDNTAAFTDSNRMILYNFKELTLFVENLGGIAAFKNAINEVRKVLDHEGLFRIVCNSSATLEWYDWLKELNFERTRVKWFMKFPKIYKKFEVFAKKEADRTVELAMALKE